MGAGEAGQIQVVGKEHDVADVVVRVESAGCVGYWMRISVG